MTLLSTIVKRNQGHFVRLQAVCAANVWTFLIQIIERSFFNSDDVTRIEILISDDVTTVFFIWTQLQAIDNSWKVLVCRITELKEIPPIVFVAWFLIFLQLHRLDTALLDFLQAAVIFLKYPPSFQSKFDILMAFIELPSRVIVLAKLFHLKVLGMWNTCYLNERNVFIRSGIQTTVPYHVRRSSNKLSRHFISLDRISI